MLAILLLVVTEAGEAATPAEARTALLAAASKLLDEAQISYVYGGYQVGDSNDCKLCNDCLTTKSPTPKARLKLCPSCARCSLDCSHFAELVHREAGVPYPYLDTSLMLSLSASALKSRYGLVDLGPALAKVEAGDLLVYDGHVVVLERAHAYVPDLPRYRGDVVHATGGKDIKRPGEGIQRERFVDLETFRGPLRRILRHAALAGVAPMPRPAAAPVVTSEPTPASPKPKLRKVEKRP